MNDILNVNKELFNSIVDQSKETQTEKKENRILKKIRTHLDLNSDFFDGWEVLEDAVTSALGFQCVGVYTKYYSLVETIKKNVESDLIKKFFKDKTKTFNDVYDLRGVLFRADHSKDIFVLVEKSPSHVFKNKFWYTVFRFSEEYTLYLTTLEKSLIFFF